MDIPHTVTLLDGVEKYSFVDCKNPDNVDNTMTDI
jgi:hypothetical protein